MRRILIFLMTTVLIVSISLFGSGCETVAETPEVTEEAVVETPEVTEEAVVETPEVIEEAIARTPFSELDGGGMTFGLYVNNLDNPYFADAAAGAERAAEELNVNLIIGASPGGLDQADQVRNLEDWIEMGVDVMGTCPPDPSGTLPVIAKSVEAGIPFITYADDAADSERSVFIATDQYEAGKILAEWTVAATGGQGKIGLIEGIPGNESNEERKQGVIDVFDNYPGITISRTLAANFSQPEALKAAEDILTAVPDINVFVCLADTMALGAVQAVKSAGKLGDIKVIGLAGSPDAIDSIKRGELDGTLVMYAGEMGYRTVEWAVRLHIGEPPPDPPFIKIPQVFIDQQLVNKIMQ